MENADVLAFASGFVRLFEVKGKKFVYDIHSCIFFEIDDIVAEALQLYVKGTKPQEIQRLLGARFTAHAVAEAINEIENLIAERWLFTPDQFDGFTPDPGQEIYALSMIISQDCNLRCRYCYADTGTFGQKRRQLMSVETARQAVDFLFAQCGNVRSLLITFFGGEPLLNFPAIRYTVEYAKQLAAQNNKEIGFSITTNGTLLTPQIQEFLAENEVAMMISLDGCKDVHDAARPWTNGTGSYDIVHKHLREVAQTPAVNYSTIRATMTRNHPDMLGAANHLAELGFPSFSVDPCYLKDDQLGFHDHNAHFQVLKEEYDRLAEEYIHRAKSGMRMPFHTFDYLMETVEKASPRVYSCCAGVGHVSIGADGSLFPCQRMVSETDYCFGDVWQGITRPEIPQMFKDSHIMARSKCASCWARHVCAGGCRAYAVSFNGNIAEPFMFDCYLMRHLVELGVYVYSELKQELPKGNRLQCAATALK